MFGHEWRTIKQSPLLFLRSPSPSIHPPLLHVLDAALLISSGPSEGGEPCTPSFSRLLPLISSHQPPCATLDTNAKEPPTTRSTSCPNLESERVVSLLVLIPFNAIDSFADSSSRGAAWNGRRGEKKKVQSTGADQVVLQ